MVTLEEITNVPVPISYGWTNDYREVVNRFIHNCKVQSGKKKIVLIQNVAIFGITRSNDNKNPIRIRQLNILKEPNFNALIAATVAGNQSVSNCTILVIGKIESRNSPVTPLCKQFYDGSAKILFDRVRDTGSNLIDNASDISRSVSNVEDYDTSSSFNIPNIITITNTEKIPDNLCNACFNLGCIDTKKKCEPEFSGLNVTEQSYVEDMISKIVDKKKKWQEISDIRKGIFSSTNVIKDIPLVEDPKNIGGYDKLKEYYRKRKKYIQKESGTIKVKGDIFVGPPGTGKSRILTAVPTMLGLPGFELDVNSSLGSLQGFVTI